MSIQIKPAAKHIQPMGFSGAWRRSGYPLG
jgi:hypothetical protein